MLGHGLAKAALFLVAGRILAAEGSSPIADVRGLLARRPAWPAAVLAGIAALLGFPPFALFATEVAIVLAGWQRRARLGDGRRAGPAADRVRRAGPARPRDDCSAPTGARPATTRQPDAQPPTRPSRARVAAAEPVGPGRQAPLLRRAWAQPPSCGFAGQPAGRPLLSEAGRSPGRCPMSRLRPHRGTETLADERLPAPWPDACSPTASGWPWSPPTTTPTRLRVVYLLPARRPDTRVELHRRGPARRPVAPQPGRRCRSPPAGSSARCATCTASARWATRCPAGWSGTATGPPAGTRCATTPTRPARSAADVGSFPFLDRRGRRGLRDPGRPGARRAHRARALPVLRRRRDHPADQGPAVVRAPRHREALRGPHPADGHRAGRTDQRRHRRRPRPRLRLAVEDAARHRRRRPTTGLPRACCSSSNGSTTTSATSAPSPTTSATASSTPTPSASARPCCASTRPLTGHRLLRGGITIGGAGLRAARTSTCCVASPTRSPRSCAITLANSVVARPVHRHRRARRRAGPATSAPSATSPAPAASTSTPARDHPMRRPRRDLPSSVVEERRRRRSPGSSSAPARSPRPPQIIADLVQRLDGRDRHRRGPTSTQPGPGRGRARHRRRLARHHRATASSSTPTARSPASRSSTRRSSTGPPCPSPWPTRSSPTSRWPTRASTCPTPATTCDSQRRRVAPRSPCVDRRAESDTPQGGENVDAEHVGWHVAPL